MSYIVLVFWNRFFSSYTPVEQLCMVDPPPKKNPHDVQKIEYLALCSQRPAKTDEKKQQQGSHDLVVSVVTNLERGIRSHPVWYHRWAEFKSKTLNWTSAEFDAADKLCHGEFGVSEDFLSSRAEISRSLLENPLFWTSEVWPRGLKVCAVAFSMYSAWYQIMVIILWSFFPPINFRATAETLESSSFLLICLSKMDRAHFPWSKLIVKKNKNKCFHNVQN